MYNTTERHDNADEYECEGSKYCRKCGYHRAMSELEQEYNNEDDWSFCDE